MNKTVSVLSIATAFFAATTAYLAYELHQRDTDAVATAALVADSAPQGTTGADVAVNHDTQGLPTNTTPAAGSAARPAGVAAPKDSVEQDLKSVAINEFARQFLARYDDSNQRPV